MATVHHIRKSDTAIAVHGTMAIDGLTRLITDAVKAGDEAQVDRLDGILRDVERLIEHARGSPRDRSRR